VAGGDTDRAAANGGGDETDGPDGAVRGDTAREAAPETDAEATLGDLVAVVDEVAGAADAAASGDDTADG
jgi:hypothetical protein